MGKWLAYDPEENKLYEFPESDEEYMEWHIREGRVIGAREVIYSLVGDRNPILVTYGEQIKAYQVLSGPMRPVMYVLWGEGENVQPKIKFINMERIPHTKDAMGVLMNPIRDPVEMTQRMHEVGLSDWAAIEMAEECFYSA